MDRNGAETAGKTIQRLLHHSNHSIYRHQTPILLRVQNVLTDRNQVWLSSERLCHHPTKTKAVAHSQSWYLALGPEWKSRSEGHSLKLSHPPGQIHTTWVAVGQRGRTTSSPPYPVNPVDIWPELGFNVKMD